MDKILRIRPIIKWDGNKRDFLPQPTSYGLDIEYGNSQDGFLVIAFVYGDNSHGYKIEILGDRYNYDFDYEEFHQLLSRASQQVLIAKLKDEECDL